MTARRVLLIDDDAEVREVARLSLELMAGWAVLGAGSGREGAALAAAEQPDAILLDVMMPDMDGAATLAQLRATPATQHIPVILLTAVALDEQARRFSQLGVAGVIDKPFEPRSLASQIAATLGWEP